MELTYTGDWTYDGSSGASVLRIGPYVALAWEDGGWRMRSDDRHGGRHLYGKSAGDLTAARAAAEAAIREHADKATR